MRILYPCSIVHFGVSPLLSIPFWWLLGIYYTAIHYEYLLSQFLLRIL